jgi:hypothetical protein
MDAFHRNICASDAQIAGNNALPVERSRRTRMYDIPNSAAATGRHPRMTRKRSQRVLLRYWGFSEHEAASLLPDLPDLDGRLTWTLDARATPRPDLVVHLVDAMRLSGVSGGARWNAMGPVDAMRKAYRRGASEVALVLGSPHHLPVQRDGCWILCGARSLAASLQIMARTTIEPLLTVTDERPWTIHDLAATNALCMLVRDTGADRDMLAHRITGTVRTALNSSYVAPAHVLVAAEAQVMDYVVSLNPLMRERMRLFRRRAAQSDLAAEVLLAYPWPTSLPRQPQL